MNIQQSTPMTPLRVRMIADMIGRNLGPASQTSHLRACKRFAAWLGRSPETATPDDVKYFQQHLVVSGVGICTRNQTMTGVKFLFRVTLRRHDLVAEIFSLKEPVKVPLVLSKKEIKPGPLLEVADVFRAVTPLACFQHDGAVWRRANAGHISLDQFKVMNAIERCRTATLGGHVARCADCAHAHNAYNSCRKYYPAGDCNAICREGVIVQSVRRVRQRHGWLRAKQSCCPCDTSTSSLPCPNPLPHLVHCYAIPCRAMDIAHQNKREIYNLLMRASADTVIKIAANPKHLGARVGVTSVLHSWGSAMTHHPHVHMIVPGGGLSADGAQWIACSRNFFLPVRVLSRLYRRLILEGLAKLHGAGKLQFFGEQSELAGPAAFDTFLQPLRKIDWVVYAKDPFAGPKAVLAYLSRYTHRVAISNSQLIHFDAASVTFKVKTYRLNGPKRHTTMTLATPEFIRRFLIHVLPKGQHRIRHYGFFGNGNRAANIARIGQVLGAKTPNQRRDDDDSHSNSDDPRRVLALPCPCCGGKLIIVETIAPAQHSRAPPATDRAAA